MNKFPPCPTVDASADAAAAYLSFDGVVKTYPEGRRRALDGVNLAIPKGVIFGLLGPNGAGKTTLLSMLVGRISPDAGSVRVDGRGITRETLTKIGMSPQEPAVYPTLTARENLEYFGRMQGLSGAHLKQRVKACLDLAEISDAADRRVEHFSGGYKRRLNLVIALIHEPELLILDETTVAIDPHSRSLIHQRLRELHAEGVTIVLSTHYMEEAEQLCHQIGIMNHGRVVTQGAVATLLTSQQNDTIKLTLERDPPETLLAQLLGLPGIQDVDLACRHLQVSAQHPEQAVGPILEVLRQAGVTPQSLSFGARSLEQMFLAMTADEGGEA
jgi:ABC-2 type transport system ATP-binding protein